MQTIPQRHQPHTASQQAAIELKPAAAEPLRYSEYHGALGGSGGGAHFSRLHDSTHGTTWYGYEKQQDQLGRTWERRYSAVVDDFGDLVEVRA